MVSAIWKLFGISKVSGTEHLGDHIDLGRRVRSDAAASIVATATAGSRNEANRVKSEDGTMELKVRHARRALLRLEDGRKPMIKLTSSGGRVSMIELRHLGILKSSAPIGRVS